MCFPLVLFEISVLSGIFVCQSGPKALCTSGIVTASPAEFSAPGELQSDLSNIHYPHVQTIKIMKMIMACKNYIWDTNNDHSVYVECNNIKPTLLNK